MAILIIGFSLFRCGEKMKQEKPISGFNFLFYLRRNLLSEGDSVEYRKYGKNHRDIITGFEKPPVDGVRLKNKGLVPGILIKKIL